MTSITHPPYAIREIDLSDLPLLKESFSQQATDIGHFRMPFLVLEYNGEIVSSCSATVSNNNALRIEVIDHATVTSQLAHLFHAKAQDYFDRKLLGMFGNEESLKRGILRFHDWINQNENSKLA